MVSIEELEQAVEESTTKKGKGIVKQAVKEVALKEVEPELDGWKGLELKEMKQYYKNVISKRREARKQLIEMRNHGKEVRAEIKKLKKAK